MPRSRPRTVRILKPLQAGRRRWRRVIIVERGRLSGPHSRCYSIVTAARTYLDLQHSSVVANAQRQRRALTAAGAGGEAAITSAGGGGDTQYLRRSAAGPSRYAWPGLDSSHQAKAGLTAAARQKRPGGCGRARIGAGVGFIERLQVHDRLALHRAACTGLAHGLWPWRCCWTQESRRPRALTLMLVGRTVSAHQIVMPRKSSQPALE